jgi:Zn-finger nucleic acid-binding protein
MSKYKIQDIIEEKGRDIFLNKLDKNYFLLDDFSIRTGKDKYPDIDGQIRLRDGNGIYLNRYLHYQLKSHKQINNPKKYYCLRKIINYLIDTNVPTILFVVDVDRQRTYWSFIDTQIESKLNLKKDNSGRSFDLTSNEINNNSAELNAKWLKFAKEDDYEKVSSGLSKIINKFELNITSCLGLLFLLKKVKKQGLSKYFSQLLKIKESESQTIIEYLEDYQVISKTVNYFLLENEQLGVESLSHLLDSGLLDFSRLDQYLEIEKDKRVMLMQLNKIKHPKVKNYFRSLITDFKDYLPRFKNNDEIHVNLELLEEYIYRVPNDALKIIKSIINSKNPLKPKTRIVKGWGEVKGKSHNDLIIECIELLNKIRYLEPKNAFALLIKLSAHQDQSIQSKAKEALKNIAGYNLYVLERLGDKPQIFLLNEVEKWSDRKLIDHCSALLEITEELLSPSFEGHSMKDYKTFSIQFGALKVSNDLKEIRERAIVLLKKLYLLVKDIEQKQKIIRTLQEATRLPDRGGYDRDMENMVLENTNTLIDYYISIIPNADNEIVKDIEEDAYWLSRRFDAKKLTRIKELQSLISSNKEYDIFRLFVGYDYYVTEPEKADPEKIDWKEVEARRKNKIQEFINNISGENYKDWERKILSVIKNYSFPESQGKFWHFNFFLNELGKQKPEIAYRLLIENEVKLEPFLTHLIAGIWESKLKRLAKELIYNWVKEGKYLSACALVFDYVGMMDKLLINEIFKKAKEIENKDVQNDTFNNIIRSIVKNYPKHKNTKNLFIKIIDELTKNENWNWIYNEWRSRDLILKSLTRADVDTIFENLLFLPDIKYPAEEVLTPIAEKYPQKVISFFYKRFLIQKNKKQEDHYDAIPYNLNELNKPLSENAEIIVPEIIKWFKKKDSLLHWEGSRLIEAIFPVFNKSLEEELIKLIKSKNDKNIRIVFNTLRAYKGEEFLHNICKELIKEYPENEDYHKEIFIVLSQMGVVSGEYGFVKGFEKKKEEIQNWKEDKSKAIKLFVKEYEDYLDKRILYEKKQADETIELRKRQFDS